MILFSLIIISPWVHKPTASRTWAYPLPSRSRSWMRSLSGTCIWRFSPPLILLIWPRGIISLCLLAASRSISYRIRSFPLSRALISIIHSLSYGAAISSNAADAHGHRDAIAFACSRLIDHDFSMYSLLVGVTLSAISLKKPISSKFLIISFVEPHLSLGSPRSSQVSTPIFLSKTAYYSQYWYWISHRPRFLYWQSSPNSG